MSIDQIFESKETLRSFEFNSDVCGVFDDMVVRSVPGYENIQDIISLAFHEFSSKKIFMDVGCSTGTTIKKLFSENNAAHGIGIDLSQDMLAIASRKCRDYQDRLTLTACDLTREIADFIEEDKKPDFIILNLVLQFIRPPDRFKLIAKAKSLCVPKTTMIVFEKIIFSDEEINIRYIDAYLRWKKSSGYSEMEISNKRQALENKLIPYLHEENLALFKECGFNHIEICYSFLNFRGYICR